MIYSTHTHTQSLVIANGNFTLSRLDALFYCGDNDNSLICSTVSVFKECTDACMDSVHVIFSLLVSIILSISLQVKPLSSLLQFYIMYNYMNLIHF